MPYRWTLTLLLTIMKGNHNNNTLMSPLVVSSRHYLFHLFVKRLYIKQRKKCVPSVHKTCQPAFRPCCFSHCPAACLLLSQRAKGDQWTIPKEHP